MSALLLVLVLGAADAGVDGGVDAPRAAVVDVVGALKGFTKGKGGHEGLTQCGACHVTSSWTDVRFNHERTGFPLTGRHARTSCKACHVTEFTVPLPRTCAGCHRDVHAAELGQRCEQCHDTQDWRSRFDVDAHRRTNFPLMGAHAALPCVECHAEARERRFSRTASTCQDCHRDDAARTEFAGALVNHVALSLTERSCRECHNPLSYKPARFPDHDRCFPISAGPHAGRACATCHATMATALTGTCSSGAGGCTSCHTNDGSGEVHDTDAVHAEKQVAGYRFSDRWCIQCHYPQGGAR